MLRRLPVAIVAGALACALPAAAAQVEYIDPGPGFTQVVTTTHDGVKTVFVSGQVGQGATLREHAESAFAGVARRLEQAGATLADVVKIRIFVKDFEPAQYATIAAARLAAFPEEDQWPASTMIGVRTLAAEGLRVEIEAIAVAGEAGADLQVERFAPSNGFSGAVAVTAHGVRTVYVAGQVAAGDSLEAQAAAVWQRVAERLEAAGASLADLVQTTTYIVDFDPDTDPPAFRAARDEALTFDHRPGSTLLGIPALAGEQLRIEIDGVAVVGADGNPVGPGVHRAGCRLHPGRCGARRRPEGGPHFRPGWTAGRFAGAAGRPGVHQPAARAGGGRGRPREPPAGGRLHARIRAGRLRRGGRGAHRAPASRTRPRRRPRCSACSRCLRTAHCWRSRGSRLLRP